MKTGSVVQLKSGGPKMTVKQIGVFTKRPGRESAYCSWFDEKGQLSQDLFDPAQLKVLEE